MSAAFKFMAGHIARVTEKAIFLEFSSEANTGIWIPKSVLCVDDERQDKLFDEPELEGIFVELWWVEAHAEEIV